MFTSPLELDYTHVRAVTTTLCKNNPCFVPTQPMRVIVDIMLVAATRAAMLCIISRRLYRHHARRCHPLRHDPPSSSSSPPPAPQPSQSPSPPPTPQPAPSPSSPPPTSSLSQSSVPIQGGQATCCASGCATFPSLAAPKSRAKTCRATMGKMVPWTPRSRPPNRSSRLEMPLHTTANNACTNTRLP